MDLAQSIRFAGRSLRRTPAFTVTAALTLVIGIGATVAIFAIINGVLLRPLPYPNAERLIGAWHELPAIGLGRANQTASTYFTYQKFAQSIEGIAVYQDGSLNVSDPGGQGEPQRLEAGFITRTLLPVLGISPVMGRNFTEVEDLPNGPAVVLISHALWQNRFAGAADVLGKTLEVNGRTREIVGVLPADFRFSVAANQLWMPLALDPNDRYPGGFNYDAVARLKPGVTLEAAQRDFTATLPRLVEVSPDFAPGITSQMLFEQTKVRPLLTPLREDVTGDIATTLWMVGGAAALVLLVAVANVANLILVRADSRQRELAVREALGAGRARVLGYFLSESAVLATGAGVVAIVVAWATIRLLVAAGPEDVPRLSELAIDWRTIGFAVGATALVALACSVIPALRVGRIPLFSALREGGRGGTAGKAQHRVRGALVAAQIALALVVLAGAGLLVRTHARLSAVRPGFDATGVATLWLSLPSARYPGDSAVARFSNALQAKVAALPGIEVAGLTSRLPLHERGRNSSPIYPTDDASYAQRVPPLQMFTTTDAGYFDAMRIPIVAGRNFDRIDAQRGGEAIVSLPTAIQFWKDSTGRAAIGKQFRQLPGNGPVYTVVGVVGGVRDTSLAGPPVQSVYFPQVLESETDFSQIRRTIAIVARGPADATVIARSVQGAIRELDASLPAFDVRPMDGVLRASRARLGFIIVVLGAAAVVTLLLGAVGLYGVMAYLVTLRTRELGVRIALGAQPSAVAGMMTRQGLTLTAVGVGAGLLLFAGVARFLQSFLFGVAPMDPLTLGAASIMLVVIAALASWIPARRASRVDPASSLRAE